MNCPVLRVSSNEGKYSEYPLKRGLNLIGRSYSKLVPDENYHYIGIITEDTKISRKHCFIEWEINDNQESFLLLYDNISINGTMLKGFKKEILDKDDMIYLINQDEIILGDTSIFVHIPLTLPMNKAIIIQKEEDKVKTIIWESKRTIK